MTTTFTVSRPFPAHIVIPGALGMAILPKSVDFIRWLGHSAKAALPAWSSIPGTAGDWAAWVQAVGSIGAILIAVWISRKAVQDAIDKETREQADKEIRLIKSLRAEVQILWENYCARIAPIIELMKQGQDVLLINGPPEKMFPIFDASARDISLISDETLRIATINVYGRARAMGGCIRYTTTLIDKISAMVEGSEREAWRQVLKNYRTNIFQAHDELGASYAVFNALVKDV